MKSFLTTNLKIETPDKRKSALKNVDNSSSPLSIPVIATKLPNSPPYLKTNTSSPSVQYATGQSFASSPESTSLPRTPYITPTQVPFHPPLMPSMPTSAPPRFITTPSSAPRSTMSYSARIPPTPISAPPRLIRTPSSGIMSPKDTQKRLEQVQEKIEEMGDTQALITFKEILRNAAAPNLFTFPEQLKSSKALSHLQLAYKERIKTYVKDSIQNTIAELIDNEFTQEFLDYIKKSETLARGIDPRFLTFVCDSLSLTHVNEPLIQAGIKCGKIYWRIVEDEKPVYHRQEKEAFEFKADNTWYMHWNQFRAFKDSGKRAGNVTIKEKRFVKVFTAKFKIENEQQKKEIQALASSIWRELKAIGILNDKNRLSHEWRAITGINLQLKVINLKIRNKLYPIIVEVFNTITENSGYKNKKDKEAAKHIPDALFSHRSERTSKQWATTSRLTHRPSEYPEYYTRHWDVGMYYSLEAHRDNEKEKTRSNLGHELQYDHIPSKYALNIECKNPGENEKDKKDKPKGDKWWTIALPKQLHKEGLTFMEQSTATFLEIIKDYFEKLESRPQDYSLSSEECWKALGAFRYLYRCHTRKPIKINGQHVIGKTQHSLLDDETMQQIDKLFLDKIKSFLRQTEEKSKPDGTVDDLTSQFSSFQASSSNPFADSKYLDASEKTSVSSTDVSPFRPESLLLSSTKVKSLSRSSSSLITRKLSNSQSDPQQPAPNLTARNLDDELKKTKTTTSYSSPSDSDIGSSFSSLSYVTDSHSTLFPSSPSASPHNLQPLQKKNRDSDLSEAYYLPSSSQSRLPSSSLHVTPKLSINLPSGFRKKK